LSKGARVVVTGRLEQREYTTREGDKRTAIDVIADELGPSLRWATAQVERTPRQDGATKKPGGGTAPSGEANPFEGEEPF
jgi:single-strand DNA-binding protein